ncbi:TnpV protein [Micromonospora sp. NPDC049903]|uniref:TnpV protein n=1 Tax=Micromonospora sp. NPDC049903 TaxID=3364276 RepID=UPI00379D29B9
MARRPRPARLPALTPSSRPQGQQRRRQRMNRYGAQAQRHWQTFLPNRYAALIADGTDLNSYFSTLGEQAAQQIDDLARNLAGPDPTGEGYLDKLGRLNQARMAAEEQVLPELILIDPETNETSPTATQSPTAGPQAASGDWIPMVEDPTDPRWQEIAEQEAAMNDDSEPPARS